MSIFKAYIRWRHSRGFGVHSPYAYRFVTDVVRPGDYGYYSYQEIYGHLKGKEAHDHHLTRLVKFIIRLAVFLKARRVVAFGAGWRAGEIAAKALGVRYVSKPGKDFQFGKEDLVLIHKGSVTTGSVEKSLEKGAAVLAMDASPEVRKVLDTPRERGVLFRGKRIMILIPKEDMGYVDYDIALTC